jgi:hypothetical protein
LQTYKPSSFHCWQLKTFWHESAERTKIAWKLSQQIFWVSFPNKLCRDDADKEQQRHTTKKNKVIDLCCLDNDNEDEMDSRGTLDGTRSGRQGHYGATTSKLEFIAVVPVFY